MEHSTHKKFAEQAVNKIKNLQNVLGLAVGGSWITNEIDEYSDLDLILVTKEKISESKNDMFELANKLGNLINGFTGEHVGEPRLLVCLYDNPLLHVDIKFVSVKEFSERVEDPHILWERDKTLSEILKTTKAEWPKLDFQWIEDRFWTWIHYATLKIGRGEYFEALEFLSYLRVFVISPLLQLKNKNLPRGLRKVEFNLEKYDLNKLKETVPIYDVNSIIKSLENSIELYLELRKELYPQSVELKDYVQERTTEFFNITRAKVEAKN